uniref:UPAR/Ly6 domain-containing protein n=1 Tax=Vombatus ursinus TaxID=29139 RepID=A0A4X2JU45_VOMUR
GGRPKHLVLPAPYSTSSHLSIPPVLPGTQVSGLPAHLVTVFGSGNRIRCYDCNPDGPCTEIVRTCEEGERCGFLEQRLNQEEQVKFPGNPTVTLIHHHPTCVAAHRCEQEETELVGGVSYTTHSSCCHGDLCNGAATTMIPSIALATLVAITLAWILPGLWGG